MTKQYRVIVFAGLRVVGLLLVLCLTPQPSLADDEATWSQIKADIVGDHNLEEGTDRLTLVAPIRAEDAAIVPIEVHIRMHDDDPHRVIQITLVVDENPAPVVGTIRFDQGQTAFDVATRVRVNSYSFIRAIAQTDDGRFYMQKAFVKAAGGCSAPALKDPTEARANLGKMRFRTFADHGEAQVQMRHPNYSGMQMDQVSRLYNPAWFVETLIVLQGDKPILSLKGGISVSEDPTFRFSYANTGEPVTVEARDNEGNVFRETFPASGS